MTIDFAALKRSRASSLESITSAVDKLNTNPTQESNDDQDVYWKPTVDKAGNGLAIFRFLPAPAAEEVPFVRFWDHGFKGPGGWYIEKSLSSIGQVDPLGEMNAELWAKGDEESKKIVRERKRRLHYVANIYMIKDSGNPENDGKVFLYKFGKKIMDKLNEAMKPEFEDETPINPFDMWEGANFRLKIRNVDDYRNYDKSEFDSPSALAGGDDKKLEEIWKAEYSLQDIVAPERFKSYDELKARLTKVLNLTGAPTSAKAAAPAPWDDEPASAPAAPIRSRAAPAPAASDDDDLNFFQNLAQ